VCRSRRASSIQVRSSAMAGPYSVAPPTRILKPLYSGGLWLPVIMTAPSTGRVAEAKYTIGVGTMPRSSTSVRSVRPSTRAANRRGECSRQSRPTATTGRRLKPVCAASTTRAATARPRSVTSSPSRSRSATPRMSYSRKMRWLTARATTGV
jgi:hypothetical protein